MVCLQIDGHAMWLKHRFKAIGDLLSHPFLDGEALPEKPHEACELRDADDMLMRDVPYIGAPDEWKGVVLAEREEGDRSLDDLAQATVGSAAAFGLEGFDELGIAVV